MSTCPRSQNKPVQNRKYIGYKTVQNVFVLLLQRIDSVENDKFHIVVGLFLDELNQCRGRS